MSEDLAAAWARYSGEREKATFATTNLLICTLMPLWSLFDAAVEPELVRPFLMVRVADALLTLGAWAYISHSSNVQRNRWAMYCSVVAVGVSIAWMLPQVPDNFLMYVLGFSLVFWGAGLLLVWPLPWVLGSFGTILAVHAGLQIGSPVNRLELVGTGFYLVSVSLIAGAQVVVRRRLEYRAFRASHSLAQQNAELTRTVRTLQETRARLDAARAAVPDSLESDVIARQTADLAVPTFASWAGLIVWEGEEGWSAYVAHHDEDTRARLEELLARHPPPIPDGALRIIDARPATLQTTLGPAGAEIEARSLLLTPLRARGQILGLVVLSRVERNYVDSEIALAEEMAHRAALALHNARLFQEATAAVRARDDFISVASHELRTPLTPLRLTMDTLGRVCADQNERVQTALRRAERQVDRLAALVDQLLDVTRLAEGRLELQREPADIAEVVREVAARFGAGADGAAAEIELEVAGAAYGMWDRSRVDQVLTNLVSNAVKYGGGKPVRVQMEVAPARVILRVTDRGIGIDPRDQARIFQRFERAVSTQSYGGLGLGLWITKSMVELMGGTIRVESTVGHGSTFVVDLPWEPARDRGMEDHGATPAPADR